MAVHEEDAGRPVPSPGVICTQLDENDAVLLDLDSDRWFILNETGFRIWREIKVGRSVAEIARLLVAEYEVTPDDAKGAIARLVDSLQAEGLLGTAPAPSPPP
jgi:hypothetical protein